MQIHRAFAAGVVALLAIGHGAGLALAGPAGDFVAPPTSPEVVGDPADTSVRSLAVGEFNDDGRPDLALGLFQSDGPDEAIALLGLGHGDFSAGFSAPELAGGVPASIAVGDFNSDSNNDLAVANTNSADITILLGDGTGDFTPAGTSPVAVGGSPGYIVAADFNRDQQLDLAVSGAADGDLTILHGDGNGGFTVGATALEATGCPVAIGDFNGDHETDLVVGRYHSGEVLLGDGNGNFTQAAPNSGAMGCASNSIVVDDFNDDGRQDIAVTDDGYSITVLLGDGTGQLTQASQHGPPNGCPQGMVAGDFNGDGRQDLAVTQRPRYPIFSCPDGGRVAVWLGDGAGDFTEAPDPQLAPGDYLGMGDFNADDKPDLAVGSHGAVRILLNNTTDTDLALSVSDSPDPIKAGQALAYRMSATNRGPDDASAVTLDVDLPSGVTFLSASAGCTHNSDNVTCSLGSLPDGASKLVEIRVAPITAGTVTTSASLSGGEQDLQQVNNTASEQTSVTRPSGSCRGVQATIVGTSGNDLLIGSSANDVIAGLGGDDEIRGRSGRDRICGGSGDDEIRSGLGPQVIFGGSGDDLALGRAGNDLLFGGAEDDELDGGTGNDSCHGGSGADTGSACETTAGIP